MKKMNNQLVVMALIAAQSLIFSGMAVAEDDATALAKKTQNPISDLISVPIMNNLSFKAGPGDDLQNTLNIMAVYPQTITDEINWIHRGIVPIVTQPEPIDQWGLSDIQYQGYMSPSQSTNIIWGAGPVLQLPTSTAHMLGTEKWSAGVGAIALQMKGPWVYGALLNNIWSFAGEDDREDVNLMFFQPFVNYNIGNGLAIGSVPQITANWSAEQGSDVWTVPVGLQLSKVKPVGDVPINWILGSYYNVGRTEYGAEWMLRFQVQILFPQ